MGHSSSLCETIERSNQRSVDRHERSKTPSRKLHWSDVLVGGLALAALLAISLHVSPVDQKSDPQPTVLKWMQEG